MREEIRQWLVNPANGRGIPVLQGTLTWTPQTIQRQVDDAKKNSAKLNTLTKTAPLVLWIVGGVMLVLGIFLTVMGSRGGGSVHRHRGPRAQKPEPAGAR